MRFLLVARIMKREDIIGNFSSKILDKMMVKYRKCVDSSLQSKFTFLRLLKLMSIIRCQLLKKDEQFMANYQISAANLKPIMNVSAIERKLFK